MKQFGTQRLTVLLATCCFIVLLSGIFRSSLLLGLFAMLVTAFVSTMLVFAILKTNLKTVLVGFVAACFCLSVVSTDWPLKAIFAASKNSLEATIVNGQRTSFHFPIWRGPARLVAIEYRERGVWFLTRKRFDESGFVKIDNHQDIDDFRVKIDLGDGWFYFVDD